MMENATNHVLDLDAARCPTALIRTRQAIQTFTVNSPTVGGLLLIQTIEPSLLRDVPFYLQHEHPELKLLEMHQAEISKDQLKTWQADDDVDDEDISDISSQYMFVIARIA